MAPERPQQQRGVEDQARVDYRVLVAWYSIAVPRQMGAEEHGHWKRAQ
jgi:hypothetical protein